MHFGARAPILVLQLMGHMGFFEGLHIAAEHELLLLAVCQQFRDDAHARAQEARRICYVEMLHLAQVVVGQHLVHLRELR